MSPREVTGSVYGLSGPLGLSTVGVTPASKVPPIGTTLVCREMPKKIL